MPSWLRSFDLVVEDEYETVLFNDYDFLPEDFNFIHDLGLAASLSDPNGVDVESIMLKDKEYKVVGIHIYSDKNTGKLDSFVLN